MDSLDKMDTQSSTGPQQENGHYKKMDPMDVERKLPNWKDLLNRTQGFMTRYKFPFKQEDIQDLKEEDYGLLQDGFKGGPSRVRGCHQNRRMYPT